MHYMEKATNPLFVELVIKFDVLCFLWIHVLSLVIGDRCRMFLVDSRLGF